MAAATSADVDFSVKKAVAWLYSQQKPAGHWEDKPQRDPELPHGSAFQMDGPTHGGWTALCTFALIEAGEKPTEPRIAKAINFLRTAQFKSAYSIGLRCMVFAKLPQTPENLAVLRADAARLTASIIPDGAGKGLWDYEFFEPGTRRTSTGGIDNSISQFGVLGLWACAQSGIDTPPQVWKEIEQAWRARQNADGGWLYTQGGLTGENFSTPGMTCAGIASLLIIKDVVGAAPAGAAGMTLTSDVAINRGLNWLNANFDKLYAEGSYALYAAERIGTASGYQFLGKHDWYKLGSGRLIATQERDGHWSAERANVASTTISETALAVLFLVHGRAPVLVTKLDYGASPGGVSREQAWNQRPRDVANLVRFTANAAEQPYNWQVSNLVMPGDDLLEVPVAYLSGAKPVVLLPRERDKLKGYLESGGMVFASSEAAPIGGVAGTDPFSKSVIDLGQKMFGYTFRELPLDHPIFADQQFRPKQWKERPIVWGLSNGVRELMVLLPMGDHGRSWNFNSAKADSMKFEVGADVLQYAVSREPPPRKGQSHVIKPKYLMELATSQPAATQPLDAIPSAISGAPAEPPVVYLKVPADARRLTIGRLKVGDNWDPEPGAWRRLANLLANDYKLFIEVRPVGATSQQLAGIKLLHWTGTTNVKLTEPERAAIEGFVKAGGTLVVDAAGGMALFADTASAELKAIFKVKGDAVGPVLTDDDPVYRLREARIEQFEYRRYLSNRVTGKLTAPRVQGIDGAGRTIVFFSREDLTAGCVGQNTDGIAGYKPATATAIMRNIALLVSKK